MSTPNDPREEALRWLVLYRDLGVERISRTHARPRALREPDVEEAAQQVHSDAPHHEPPLIGPDIETLQKLLAGRPSADQGLAQLRDQVIGDCRRCRLCETRTQLVFGVGNPHARLMFVGEGPGADEDLKGEPFVGRAGQLLDKIILAMGLQRAEVYIANIVKCRPPENRAPMPDESAACISFLFTQIALLKPEVIVALGRTALEGLAGPQAEGITKLRGRWFEHQGIPVIATFHPAYLLRNPAAKRPVWDDMQTVMRQLGLATP
ncbi:MAG: uracil-DNA glycosylase [Acidobacteriota bacterium]